MAVYKSFDINTVTTVKPWGAREEQVIRDLIDTLVVDTIDAAKNTSGHLHGKMYADDSVSAFDSSTSNSITITMRDNESSGLVITNRTGTSIMEIDSSTSAPKATLDCDTDVVGQLYGDIYNLYDHLAIQTRAESKVIYFYPTEKGGYDLQLDTTIYTFRIHDDATELFRIHEPATGYEASFDIPLNVNDDAYISGTLGIGIDPPDGTLHVHTATAGTVDAPTGADDLVVENNGNAGISILSPDADYSQIYFGSPSVPSAAFLQWNHDNDAYRLGTIKTGAEVIFLSGNSTQAMVIDSSQNVEISGGFLTLEEEGIRLNRTGGSGYINFQDGSGTNNWQFSHANTDNVLGLFSSNLDGNLRIGKDNTPTQFCLDTSTGDVGIGLVPTGAAKLEVNSATSDTVASFTSTDANAKIALIDSSSTQYVVTQNSILSLGPNGGYASFAGNLNIDASGHVGIGVVSPDGPLHVHTATAGTVSISTSADDLIVENGANAGISILSPDANYSSVFFGSPSHGSGGAISWKFDDSNMLISVTTDSHIIFRYDDSTEAMRIDGTTGYVGIGTGASPSELLHIYKTTDPKLEVEDQNSSLTLTVESSAAIVESEDLDLTLKAPAANTILCSTAKFFRLPVKTDTGDPSSPTDGDCYVNTQDNTVRCYADGAWRDLVTW